MSSEVIVCYARCWGCVYDQHYEPPEWHTWADMEDIEANPDAAKSRCGCFCAVLVGASRQGDIP